MAYQSWEGVWCKRHQCRIKLRRGEGHYVAYPQPMALCDVHYQEWKENNKAAKQAAKQKKLQKPTLFD